MRNETHESYVDHHVGRQVQLHRKAKGLSLDDLAATVGLSTKQLNQFETGRERMPPDCLRNLCVALSVRPQTLFRDLEVLGARQLLGAPIVTPTRRVGFQR